MVKALVTWSLLHEERQEQTASDWCVLLGAEHSSILPDPFFKLSIPVFLSVFSCVDQGGGEAAGWDLELKDVRGKKG